MSPSGGLHVGAVTGTNAKTSTVELARQIMVHAGRPAASLGTLGLVDRHGRRQDPGLAPGAAALADLATALSRTGTQHLFLEAYSHALTTTVLAEVEIGSAAFTNLSPEHLGRHRSLRDYYLAKRRLVSDIVVAGGTVVLNRDVPEYADLHRVATRRALSVITFGRSPAADLRLVSSTVTAGSGHATLTFFGRRLDCDLHLGSALMAGNALGAVGLALAAGTDEARVEAALPGLRAPVGRLEPVPAPPGTQIYVDFAHTPGALAAVLGTLRPRTAQRLVVVLGCGGDRDRGKRALMGQVAAELADTVIVTDDNPRHEDPASIRQAILAQCPKALDIGDRATAIEVAVGRLGPGDVLVVAGKGHERTQDLGGRTVPFSDHEAVRVAVLARRRVPDAAPTGRPGTNP